MIGREHRLNPRLSRFERAYIALFGYPAQGLRVRAATVMPMVRRLNNPQSILDVGCGCGVLTMAAARHFPLARVVGMDMDADRIGANAEVAERAGLRNCGFAVGDATRLPEDSRYDAILATDIFEHVADDQGLARTLAHALSANGRLIVHVPNETRRILWMRRQNFMGIEGHVRPGYSMAGLRALFDGAGLMVEGASYTYNSAQTFMNDVSYLITRGREHRRRLYAGVFPLLLLASSACSWRPRNRGSGIVAQARRADAA